MLMTTLIFTGCLKNGSTDGVIPTVQESIEIDIEDDGVVDFSIDYFEKDIHPIDDNGGTFGICGRIEPLGLNEILEHREDGPLFIRNIEEIEESVFEPLRWITSSRIIVSITTINSDGDWPNAWEINLQSVQPTYIIGLKLVSNFQIHLAWIEIEIDPINGLVTLVDKGIL